LSVRAGGRLTQQSEFEDVVVKSGKDGALVRVKDVGTVTSPLVPWNSCGAYMAGVLGVATIKYLPYAFFNLLNPIIALVYAYTGFRVEHVPPTESQTATAEPTGAPPPSILVAEGDLHVQ